MALKGFDISDIPSGSSKAASGTNFSNLSLDSLSLGDNEAPPANKSLPPVQLTDSAPIEPQTIEPYFLNIGEVKVTTAAQNEAAGVEPDFIIGEDGKIRQNPDKAVIASDGNLNIQVEGNESEAIKAANEAQKATVRELIRYYQKYNPGKPVPQEWMDKLHAQPDLPAQNTRADNRSSVAPDYDPGNSSRASNSYSPPSGRRHSATPFSPSGRSSSPGSRASMSNPGFDNSGRAWTPSEVGPRAILKPSGLLLVTLP